MTAEPIHGFWEVADKPSEGMPVVAIVEDVATINADGIPAIVTHLSMLSPLIGFDVVVPMAILPVGDPPEGLDIGDELLVKFIIRACRVCGCTTKRPCQSGCYWIDADLCSRCEGPPLILNPSGMPARG